MNRNLIQLYIALFTWGIGESMFFIFQPIYLKQWGLSPVMIGTIIGVSGFFMIFSQVPAGYLADRYGSSRVIQVIWVIGAVSTWLMAVSQILPLFIIGYMVYYTTACVVPPLNSYVSSMRGNVSLERTITMTSVSYNSGAIIGPIIGGILADRIGLRNIYFIAGTIFIISNVFIFLIKPDKSHLHTEKIRFGTTINNKRFITLMMLVFITCLALYLPQPLTPNYLQGEKHLSLSVIGQLGSLCNVGNAAFSLIFGSLNAIKGLMIGQLSMIFYALIFLKGDTSWVFAIGSFFVGGYRLVRNLYPAFARPMVHHSEKGVAFGMLESAMTVTVMIAPPFAGVLFTRDPVLIYSVSLVLIVIAITLNIFFLPRLEVVQDEAGVSITSE